MARQPETERTFSSTRWVPAPGKILPHASATARSATKSHRRHFSRPWEPRNPLTLTVKYRGGAECWYEIVARGESWRFTGHTALHDALRAIYEA